MQKKLIRINLFLIVLLVVGNLLFLDFVWVKESAKGKSPSEARQPEVATDVSNDQPKEIQTTVVDSQACPASCQAQTKEEIQKAIENLATSSKNAVISSQPTAAPARSSKISYLPIGSSLSLQVSSWTDVPSTDFIFNLADYPNLKNVRWEASFRTAAPGNEASVRLYDVTNQRGVDGSDLNTNSGTSVLLRSGDLSLWRGDNTYRVQAKSAVSSIVYLDSLRLKIIQE